MPAETWFGSATAALIAGLEVSVTPGEWVAVSPNVCPNVVAAIYGAGCRPWFVDIEGERQGMDPERLKEVIDQVAAVIAVHAYGVPCHIEGIASLCHHAGVVLLEDCAQAEGASYRGRAVGSFGDIAVFSYGTGKIVEAGGGGRALSGPQWAGQMDQVARQWPSAEEASAGEDLGQIYKLFYNLFYPDRVELARDAFMSLVNELLPELKRGCDQERIEFLIEKRRDCQALVQERRRKYALYMERLGGYSKITSFPLVPGAAPWRFNLQVDPDRRDALFRELLARGTRVSTWYPRATLFLPPHACRATTLETAAQFERTLLNLWVDEHTSDETILQTCEQIEAML